MYTYITSWKLYHSSSWVGTIPWHRALPVSSAMTWKLLWGCPWVLIRHPETRPSYVISIDFRHLSQNPTYIHLLAIADKIVWELIINSIRGKAKKKFTFLKNEVAAMTYCNCNTSVSRWNYDYCLGVCMSLVGIKINERIIMLFIHINERVPETYC